MNSTIPVCYFGAKLTGVDKANLKTYDKAGIREALVGFQMSF
jgi:hypothetical protein